MKALIAFSLNRRLNNTVSWMLYAFSFTLFGLVMFADILLASFAPALVLPKSIHMSSSMIDIVEEHLPSNYVYQPELSKADFQVHIKENGYFVVGDLKSEDQHIINQLIHVYHRISMIDKMPDSLVFLLDEVMITNVEWENVVDAPSNHLGFIVITSI